MRNHEDLMKGEQEIARAELSREKERLARERKERKRAAARELAAARAKIEEDAKVMIGETTRAALKEVERLSMLCREQKNEISSLRTRLTNASQLRDAIESTSPISPETSLLSSSALESGGNIDNKGTVQSTAISVNDTAWTHTEDLGNQWFQL